MAEQHRNDTCGDKDELVDEVDVTKETIAGKKDCTSKKPCNQCGSTTHSRSSHRLCPYNKNKENAIKVEVLEVEQAPSTTFSFDELSEGSSESAKEYWDGLLSDDKLDVDMLKEMVMSSGTCWALRAHLPNEPQGTLPPHSPFTVQGTLSCCTVLT